MLDVLRAVCKHWRKRSSRTTNGAFSGTRFRQYSFTALAIGIGWCLILPGSVGADREQAKVIFRKRCMACHTYGKGIKIGPDLKDVTDRRKRDWLLKFIASSSSVIKSGDPTAAKLFRDFKHERMPDWSDLTQNQISDLIEYLASAGPLQKEPDERDASTATAREIEEGRRLFHGQTPFKYGGQACHTCHAIGTDDPGDGRLGPSLTRTYSKYRDRALTDFLRRPCFIREPELSTSEYLTPQESFNLKAYMARANPFFVPRRSEGVGGAP